ncbi:MAG: class I SAM-dependent methyltransferase [Halioglobus sp.]
MAFYDDYILPRFIRCACGTKPIMKQREKVVPRAQGTVLEIGIGPGLNLPYYDSDKVDRLIGLDPSQASWELVGEKAQGLGFDVEFVGLPGEQIPLDDNSVDSIVVTYSLCTIPDPHAALQGMARVLKPGGELVFSEHGKAPDAGVAKWQDRVNPMWKKFAGGCNLNRDIPKLLGDGGFAVSELDECYLPGTPKIAGFTYWGSARLA